MAGKGRGRTWRTWGLILGPLGLAGCGKTTESYKAGIPDKAWPARSFLTDRAAVRDPIGQQAANGAVVNATLFNYFFEVVNAELDPEGRLRTLPYPRPTAKLTIWGKDQLNRLARHATDAQVCVYVQTAQEVANTRGGPAEEAKAREALNAQRVQAVQEYLAAVRSDLVARVEINDPDPVGMTGLETRNGYNKLMAAPQGLLSGEAILGVSIGSGALFSNSGGGGGGGGGSGAGQPTPPPPPEPPPPAGAAPGGLAPGGS